jgi:hypothetical protein
LKNKGPALEAGNTYCIDEPFYQGCTSASALLAATVAAIFPDDLGRTVATVRVLQSCGEIVVRALDDGSGFADLAVGRFVAFVRQARAGLFVS